MARIFLALLLILALPARGAEVRIDAAKRYQTITGWEATLDLSDTNSLEEALAKIARFAEENQGRPWILGRGWNQEKWGLGRFPTAAELDSVVSDRPVWSERVDGHASWGNTLAIEQAGVTAATQDPTGGRIIRDASGAPTGVFIDNAANLVGQTVPAPRPEDHPQVDSQVHGLP